MKKKMIALFALFAAVAVTASSESGTYAKYVTEATGSDEARVAKWGIGKTMTVDLFKSSYDNNAVYHKSEKLVAPGTTGVYTFQINDEAAPEVAYKLDVAIDEGSQDETGKLRFWTGDATSYEEALSSGGKQYANFDALKSNFGTDLSIAKVLPTDTLADRLGTVKLHWEWQFDSSDDTNDTTKGDAGTAKVTIKVKVTATQLDTVEA